MKSEIFAEKEKEFIYKIFVQFKEKKVEKPFVAVEYLAGEANEFEKKTIGETQTIRLDMTLLKRI